MVANGRQMGVLEAFGIGPKSVGTGLGERNTRSRLCEMTDSYT